MIINIISIECSDVEEDNDSAADDAQDDDDDLFDDSDCDDDDAQ
jgi:hypothetical protein